MLQQQQNDNVRTHLDEMWNDGSTRKKLFANIDATKAQFNKNKNLNALHPRSSNTLYCIFE